MTHELGPLPESVHLYHDAVARKSDLLYTADQLRAYAAAEVARAVAAERERWTRVAQAAQAVTEDAKDRIEVFEVPSHLMAAMALALDEATKGAQAHGQTPGSQG